MHPAGLVECSDRGRVLAHVEPARAQVAAAARVQPRCVQLGAALKRGVGPREGLKMQSGTCATKVGMRAEGKPAKPVDSIPKGHIFLMPNTCNFHISHAALRMGMGRWVQPDGLVSSEFDTKPVATSDWLCLCACARHLGHTINHITPHPLKPAGGLRHCWCSLSVLYSTSWWVVWSRRCGHGALRLKVWEWRASPLRMTV